MISYGYGRVLHVDLSTGSIEKRDIDPVFARKFGGGIGFGCKILYDQVGPETDSLSPENIIIIAPGPLCGTQAPYASRTEITTRDPLTGSIGSGNTGGMLGPNLKHAGFEALVIEGKSEKPVYIDINNDTVEVKNAGHLWGKDAYETTDAIKQATGRAVSVTAIGIAGENMVRFSCPVTDYYHYAARAGAGPVMGSKNLKAVAVRGTGEVKIARPGAFKAAVKEARDRVLSRKSSTSDNIIKQAMTKGSLPAKNWQTGFLPGFQETLGLEAAQKYFSRKVGTCYSCPSQCIGVVEIKDGKYAGLKFGEAMRPGMKFSWGGTCAIDNLPAVWKCMELCGRFGLDYCSTANSIGFSMELFQRGLITKTDADGLDLRWGNEEAVMALLLKIALRQGFGDVLADGVLQAAKRIGKGAERYAMTTKGRELSWQEPRSGDRGFIFGFLTNPRGGDNLKGTHFHADIFEADWWVDKFDIFEDFKQKMYCVPAEETSSRWEGKPAMCVWFENLLSVANTLGVCFFPAAMTLTLGPTHFSRLYSAYTGWDTTPQEMMNLGERNFNLLKAYTIRQGWSRKDDHLPDRFYTEPLPEGPTKGAVLSREMIDRLLDEYYELRDWDKASGLPTKEKLVELGLVDVANDLLERGKLPKR